ncbi:MAG: xanthine dehydrogenase, partial [Ferruginibacter sp.]|nr:xanthine dehydrogenase [Ferruginibacter sp.]
MKNIDSFTHTRGESIYLDDIPVVAGTLFGAVFGSPIAHGKITKLDVSAAEEMKGVVRIFTYKDIPGQNQIGGIVADEPLLAEEEVHFNGMPVAFVVAETEEISHAALHKIIFETTALPVIT